MKTKLAVAAGLAALAVPAAAQADKPAEPGKQGRDKAAQKKAAKALKQKGVGFVVKGVSAQLPLDAESDALTGAVVLDPTSANKHARNALSLGTPEALRTSTDTVEITDALAGVKVSYEGFGEDKTLAATDTVKVIGKVVRSKSSSQTAKTSSKHGNKPSWSYGAIDIRKVVVTREAPEQTEQPAAPQA